MEVYVSWYIGIDFGTRYWGLARGIHGVVEPIGSIPVIGGIPNWEVLHGLVKPWYDGKWVIGIPVGSSGELLLAGCVLKRHWRMIHKNLGGSLFEVDETLTSVEARGRLMAMNRKSNKKSDVDAMSACLILERFYEEHGVGA